MKKVILCSCLVAALLCCLILPSFAADWFSSQTMTGYTLTITDSGAYYTNTSAFESWLVAVGATSRDSAVGSFTMGTSNGVKTGPVYKSGSYVVCATTNDDNIANSNGYLRGGSATINSLDGYDLAQTIEGATVEPVYSAGQGFVTSGFSNGLSIAGTVVNFCTSNTYVLIAIGLAVAVPLVGWGISKLKSLIKGY